MPSSNKVPFLFILALAGCGGGGGYDAAPTVALPPASAVEPDASSAPLAAVPLPNERGLPLEVAQERGPHGTSGETHEDDVGYATLMVEPPEPRWSNVAVGVAYPGLPSGTLVELTALDTGRTIVALVVGRNPGGALVALSPGAAQALGVADRAPIRIRSVVANPQDELALRSGQAAAARLDAPATLLKALRRKVSGRLAVLPRAAALQRAATPVARPTAPTSSVRSGLVVQVATLSSAARAAALARDLGGHVAASGSLYRVQLGPFADSAAAGRARDGVARRGYRDARILRTESQE